MFSCSTVTLLKISLTSGYRLWNPPLQCLQTDLLARQRKAENRCS